MGTTLRIQGEALEALRKVTASRRLRKLLAQHRRTDRAQPVTYTSGDWVYFRRPVDNKGENPYRGPGQVIGALDHSVFIRFGGQVVSAHPADVLKFAADQQQDAPEKDESLGSGVRRAAEPTVGKAKNNDPLAELRKEILGE